MLAKATREETHATKKAKTVILLTLLFFAIANSILTAQAAKTTYLFTATISPTEVNISQLATFTVTITDTGTSALGSASIAIPIEFTVSTLVTILTPSSGWNSSLSSTAINVSAIAGGSAINQGESVAFTFSAIAPSAPSEANWTTEANTSINGNGQGLTIEGPQPAVTVTSLTMVSPVILPSPEIIDQGQVSLISQTAGASGGTLPYTYQWLEALDAGEFTPISGANGPSYTFSTTTLTSTGTWRFQLSVTDSSTIPVTVTSNSAIVIVNSALLASVVTANPNPVQQSQPSTLISSPVLTGTSPYTYQWFQKTPGGEYIIVGPNSESYTFPGSTITGDWAFVIQVTDSAANSINSSELLLNVYETPTFTITVSQTAHGTITPGTTTVSLGSDQSFTILPSSGYHISDVLVDGVSVGPVTSYTFTGVAADHTIAANFQISGSQTYYFINVASPHGSPTPSAQVIQGGSYSASVTSPDGDSSHRWVCIGYSLDGGMTVSGTSYTFSNIQANRTITFSWQEQYYLTVVSQDGSKNGEGWYDSGATATVSVTSGTRLIGSGTRQVFTGWTGGATGTGTTSDPIMMSGPKTATAAWLTQYEVIYATSGNVLQVTIPLTEWVNSGAASTAQFAASATNSAGDTKNVFVSDNRPSTISVPVIITAIYETQYLVTFAQNGLSPQVSGTVVTVLGKTRTYDLLPDRAWINTGDTVTFNYSATVENAKTGEKFTLISTNCTSPLTIEGPTTISANYQLQTSSSLNLPLIAIAAVLVTIPPVAAVSLVMKKREGGEKKITPVVIGAGSISPSTTQRIQRGGDSTVFIITANPGNKIKDVIIDKTIHLGAERTYKFLKVNRDHTIQALFCED